MHKLEPKAQECFYLGPSMNHPRDAMRVLTKGRIVVTTRNVTWRRIPGLKRRHLVFGRVEGSQDDEDADEFEITRSCGGHESRGASGEADDGQLDDGTDGVDHVEPESQSDGIVERESGADTLNQELDSSQNVAGEGASLPLSSDIQQEPESKSEEGLDVEVEVEVDVCAESPTVDDGPPSRRTRSRSAAVNSNVGLTALIDEKSVFEVSYALAGKAALDSLKDKVPYVPLSDIEPEPESYDEAMKSKYKNDWVQVMTAELAGLKNTNMFQPAVKPDDRKAVGAKWVFKWKTDQAGRVVKAKARLVAKGFS